MSGPREASHRLRFCGGVVPSWTLLGLLRNGYRRQQPARLDSTNHEKEEACGEIEFTNSYIDLDENFEW